jgi:hypothetical protein
MSLKAFHLFFISASIVLSIGFGTWAAREYVSSGGAINLLWLGVAAIGAVGLAVYERSVLKKFKKAGI